MSKSYIFVRALVINILAWIIFLLFLLIFYFAWFRDYQMNWGATAEDISRYMPGDEYFENPKFNATRAVEIEATPEQIWPWIVQMGYRRGGFYGFDKLDNGGYPSAESILPEYQNLKVGDSIPSGEYTRGELKGELFYLLRVVEMDSQSSMLWVFLGTPWMGATWSWGLYPIDENRTRLVSRLRQDYEFDSPEAIIAWSFMDAIEILMMRTTLLGIKRRAENM